MSLEGQTGLGETIRIPNLVLASSALFHLPYTHFKMSSLFHWSQITACFVSDSLKEEIHQDPVSCLFSAILMKQRMKLHIFVLGTLTPIHSDLQQESITNLSIKPHNTTYSLVFSPLILRYYKSFFVGGRKKKFRSTGV